MNKEQGGVGEALAINGVHYKKKFLRIFKADFLLPVIGTLLITFLVKNGPVRYTDSDPKWNLLLSQSIIGGTFKLDSYASVFNFSNDYKITVKNGHFHYYYPPGTPIFSVPFVLIANLLGRDMANLNDNYQLQKIISAFLCSLIYFILYRIARCYLNAVHSFIIVTFSFLGSSLISTMGTALWSSNFCILFECIVMLIFALNDTGTSRMLNPFLIAFLLFSAFICKPTSAIFIILSFSYIFTKHRNISLKVFLIALLFFLSFVLFSFVEYGQFLPDYYLPQCHAHNRNLWLAIKGNLFSPARGIFVYSPSFVLVFLGGFYQFIRYMKIKLFFAIFGLLWFFLYLIVISAANNSWWGGHSFGPRLFMEVVPGIILALAILWHVAFMISPRVRKFLAIVFLILSAPAVFINTYQGLYNVSAARWNRDPNIDSYPEYLNDWKYPQFLASEELLKRRVREHNLKYNIEN